MGWRAITGIVIVVGLAFIAGYLCGVADERRSAGPTRPAAATACARIVADEAVHRFAPVSSESSVDHVFRVRNEGTVDLVIREVRPSCGCVVAVLPTRVVPPGGALEVKASFRAQGFSGHVHQEIELSTNDPDAPNFLLSMEGDVIGP